MLNKYNKRLNLIKKISDLIKSDNDSKITLGYCGSVSTKTLGSQSDIDLNYFIESQNFGKILKSKSFSENFPLSKITGNERIDEFENGSYDVYAVKSNAEGIRIGLHLSSKDFSESLSELDEFMIRRFRVHSVNDVAIFRSFDNRAKDSSIGDDYIEIEFHNITYPDGYTSDTPSLIKRDNKTYYGLHVDRLFTTEFSHDPLNIKKLQLDMQKKLHEEWLNGPYGKDEYGFLRKRLNMPDDIIEKFRKRIK